MDLDGDGDAAIFQPGDERHLPQRPVEAQRPAVDLGERGVELGPAARSGQLQLVNVLADGEVRVIDPDRMMQIERHAHGAALHAGQQMDPARELVDEPGAVELAPLSR